MLPSLWNGASDGAICLLQGGHRNSLVYRTSLPPEKDRRKWGWLYARVLHHNLVLRTSELWPLGALGQSRLLEIPDTSQKWACLIITFQSLARRSLWTCGLGQKSAANKECWDALQFSSQKQEIRETHFHDLNDINNLLILFYFVLPWGLWCIRSPESDSHIRCHTLGLLQPLCYQPSSENKATLHSWLFPSFHEKSRLKPCSSERPLQPLNPPLCPRDKHCFTGLTPFLPQSSGTQNP